MILAAFIYRLMTQKLPRDMQRPGVFISIGPSGFTVAGIGKLAEFSLRRWSQVSQPIKLTQFFMTVQLGRLAGEFIPEDFMGPGMSGHAAFIMMLMSSLLGLWLWGLAIWYALPIYPMRDRSTKLTTYSLQVLHRIGGELLEIRSARA